MATGEDPTSVAIASIQSAATFPDPNVKYVFRTENGGQVREGARWQQMSPGVGVQGGAWMCFGELWLGEGDEALYYWGDSRKLKC